MILGQKERERDKNLEEIHSDVAFEALVWPKTTYKSTSKINVKDQLVYKEVNQLQHRGP